MLEEQNEQILWITRDMKIFRYLLTLAVASIFSGSTKVRNKPISWTAPPSSGSVSQIMCSMMRLMSKISWFKK